MVQPGLPLHISHLALTSPAWSLSLGYHSRSTHPSHLEAPMPAVYPGLLPISCASAHFPLTLPIRVPIHSRWGLSCLGGALTQPTKHSRGHLTLLNVNKELSYREVKDLFIEKMPAALSKPHWMRSQSASWCSLPGVFLLSPTCSTVPSLQSQLRNW